MQSAECSSLREMKNAECSSLREMQNAKCSSLREMQNAECKMQNCGRDFILLYEFILSPQSKLCGKGEFVNYKLYFVGVDVYSDPSIYRYIKSKL